MESPTTASEIALPVEMVTLDHLKTKDGVPVTVRVEACDELVAVRTLQSLPGLRDAPKKKDGEEQDSGAVRASLEAAVGAGLFDLIEQTCMLTGADGSLFPAFYFHEDRPHHAESIPGRLLRVSDKLKLASTVLRLSGFSEEAAGTSFHVPVGAGRNGGDGAVAAGEGERDDAVASAS